jgi:hypothetical protein
LEIGLLKGVLSGSQNATDPTVAVGVDSNWQAVAEADGWGGSTVVLVVVGVVVVGAGAVVGGSTVVEGEGTGALATQDTTPPDELTCFQCAEPLEHLTDHDCPGRRVVPVDVADAVVTVANNATAMIPSTIEVRCLRRRSRILVAEPLRIERMLQGQQPNHLAGGPHEPPFGTVRRLL